jgi:hypothetical protein
MQVVGSFSPDKCVPIMCAGPCYRTDIRYAVLGNAGTIISFRVDAEDASYLEHEFQEPFDRTDLA